MRTMKANNLERHKEVVYMFKKKRKGVALITVVLISALIFVSIIGITLKVVPENKIVVARSASERALSAAETGLSQVIFNLRNADFKNGTTVPSSSTAAYLKISDVEDIARASAGAVLPPSPSTTYGKMAVPGGDGVPYVTYEVKIKKVSGDSFDPNYDRDTLENTLEIYSLGTVYDKEGGNVIARKAIKTGCLVTFKVNPATGGTSNPNPVDLKYGIVSGGNMNFIGNSNRVFHGDIYAGGMIDKNSNNDNSNIVLDGSAYASGSIDPGIVPDADPPKKYEGVPSPSNTIDKIIAELSKYNKSLADAFIAGAYPFDGTETANGYPNTNRSSLSGTDQAIINSIFVNYLGDNTNFSKVSSFYNDLESGKIYTNYQSGLSSTGQAFLQNLANPAYKSNIVCYYKGDVDKKDLPDNIKLGGVLIIDGDLSITSSITINPGDPNHVPPIPPNPLLIRVTGDVDLAGNATLYGNIFASGEDANQKVGVGDFTLNGFLVTPRDINVNGTFSCNGSLLTKGSINLKGTTNITYADTGLGSITVSITPPTPPAPAELVNVNDANAAPTETNKAPWKEISYDEFQNP